MAKANVIELLRRWDELKAERAPYESMRQELADYIDPWRGSARDEFTPGDKRTTKIFDSTVISARKLLAATLHATLTPDTQPWLSFVMRQREYNELEGVADWLEACADRMHLAYRQSNFATRVHEMYNDLVGPPATGALFVEERPPSANGAFGGFRFRAYPAKSYVISEDYEGTVDTVFVESRPTARAIVAKWGEDKVGDKVREAAKKKPDTRFTVLHAVAPRESYTADGKGGSLNMPWLSCYLIVETKVKLAEGGFHEFPFMVPRWDKASDEIYGTGPAHVAGPDVRTLNAVKQFTLEAAPLAMFPPTVELDDSVIGEPDLRPMGRNRVSAYGARSLSEVFAFMQTGMKLDVSQIVVADLRTAILEAYFIPQLRLKDSPQMTATEVQARLDEMYRYLGPTLARLQSEFLTPLVQRSFSIMARARALPEMPMALQEVIGAAELDIEYEGPLARAQRQIELVAQDRVVSFVAGLTQAMTAAGIPPEQAAAVWDVLEIDKMVRDRASITGVRSDSVREEQQTQEIRAARAEQQAEQAKLQQAGQMAEMAGKAAPALKALDEASRNGGGQVGRAA